MSLEQRLAEFIQRVSYDDLDEETIKTVKRQLAAFFGALIAGSSTNATAVAEYTKEVGGKPEATVFVIGGRIPAHQAAFTNAAIGRALDIDDHISPGAHIGSAVIPAAFAVAELICGCSGKDLITAIAAGTEVSLRLLLDENDYAGFDPTGVSAVFATAAATSKILGFDEFMTRNTLGLISDRSGASYQHYIDGVMGGPLMEGWVAQAGVDCARLTQKGLTGTVNFLEGVYGYFHLFGRDKEDLSYVTADLGNKWHLRNLNFKKYPSCGMTQGSTELILKMMEKYSFTADDVERIKIRIPPYAFKLVGHPFKVGDNPRVDAQFNVAYCVANALIRAPVILSHFDAEFISDLRISQFVHNNIEVVSDVSVDRTHYSSDIHVQIKGGNEYHGQIDIPPGTPANPMSDEEHRRRFFDCVEYSGKSWLKGREEEILDCIETLETKDDACGIIPLFQP